MDDFLPRNNMVAILHENTVMLYLVVWELSVFQNSHVQLHHIQTSENFNTDQRFAIVQARPVETTQDYLTLMPSGNASEFKFGYCHASTLNSLRVYRKKMQSLSNKCATRVQVDMPNPVGFSCCEM